MQNTLLGLTAKPIIYNKALRKITGSVTGAILMQQLEFYFVRYPDGFYKFLEPSPKNKSYNEGDSWTEELGFSKEEFRTAFDTIGRRYGSKKEFDASQDKFDGRLYASYHDKIKGTTHYFRNHAEVDRWISELSAFHVNRVSQFTVSGESQFTEVVKPNLRKSGIPISNCTDTCTDITTEKTTDINVVSQSETTTTPITAEFFPTQHGRFMELAKRLNGGFIAVGGREAVAAKQLRKIIEEGICTEANVFGCAAWMWMTKKFKGQGGSDGYARSLGSILKEISAYVQMVKDGTLDVKKFENREQRNERIRSERDAEQITDLAADFQTQLEGALARK
jgi:hypothetical protein